MPSSPNYKRDLKQERRTAIKRGETGYCLVCSSEFESKSNNQKFCSSRCRYKYNDNKDKRNTAKYGRRAIRLEFIRSTKMDIGCSICGYKDHPSALQFDHIDPKTKSFNLSRGHLMGVDKIKEELSKCRVLCANCHAVHTYNQGLKDNAI